MFSSVYKTTLKNLFRSLIFWLAAAFVIGVTVYEVLNGHYGVYDHTLNEMIYDTDPRFVLSYIHYKSLAQNVCIADVMYYSMPIFTVISTVLVLNRDYGDQFFEIEKASGVKAITYTGGRLAALVTVNFALAAIACFLGTYLYLLVRGGPAEIKGWEMIWDTFKRLARFIPVMPFPTTLFYITFTYFLGSIFNSGLISAIGSMAHVIATYVCGFQLRFRIPDIYHDYFSINNASKLRMYFYYHPWDAEYKSFVISQGTSFKDAALCFSFVVGLAVICSVVSYIRVRKRSV